MWPGGGGVKTGVDPGDVGGGGGSRQELTLVMWGGGGGGVKTGVDPVWCGRGVIQEVTLCDVAGMGGDQGRG